MSRIKRAVPSKSATRERWDKVFFGARSRILISYVVLMAFSTIASLLGIRQVLLVQLEKRIEKSVQQEMKEFQRVVKGRNPTTGQPFGDNVIAIFDKYLSRNFPDDNEVFIALLNGQFYKSDPKIIPASLKLDSQVFKHWGKLTLSQQGKKVTPKGSFIYLAEPVIRDKIHGVMIVVHSTAIETQQVNEQILDFMQVSFIVLSVASVLAWLVAGRVLAPLRLLTDTARSITESDLTRRIRVRGSDEIAELTITFNEMLERLQSAFKSQRDFINDAGHELRTPITIIRGHLELLGDDPEDRYETLEIVIDELDRMNRFVDDLLLLAKAEQPNFLYLETVDIGLLTQELYAKVKALAQRDWRLEKTGTGLIVADRQRLTQAIMNLAQNATQHTTDKDMIALGCALSHGRAHFWVRDTGVGIADADQYRIFERFVRAGDSRCRSEGSGLGLAIVRAIAQAHGGDVELNSRLGGGSTFTIVIPLEPPQEVLVHESNFNC
jgi:signal transduction histidine kinase